MDKVDLLKKQLPHLWFKVGSTVYEFFFYFVFVTRPFLAKRPARGRNGWKSSKFAKFKIITVDLKSIAKRETSSYWQKLSQLIDSPAKKCWVKTLIYCSVIFKLVLKVSRNTPKLFFIQVTIIIINKIYLLSLVEYTLPSSSSGAVALYFNIENRGVPISS